MSLREFFRDPFHRGMSLLFVAHILSLVLIVDIASRHPLKPPPDCLAPVLFVAGLALMLLAGAKM